MDIKDIEQLGHFLYFSMFKEKTNIPITINKRYKVALGAFYPPYDEEDYESDDVLIQISKLVAEQDIYIIADVLAHELTHYHLWKKGKEYSDNSKEFIQTLNEFGISATNTSFIPNNSNKILYLYHKIEYSCSCSQTTYAYFLNINLNNLPIIQCGNCKKDKTIKDISNEYIDYKPPIFIKDTVDKFINKQNKKRKTR